MSTPLRSSAADLKLSRSGIVSTLPKPGGVANVPGPREVLGQSIAQRMLVFLPSGKNRRLQLGCCTSDGDEIPLGLQKLRRKAKFEREELPLRHRESDRRRGIVIVTDERSLLKLIREKIAEVVVGYDRAINLLLVALLSEGHVLLEDVPGVGKTLMARTLARVTGLTFRRIQFTPDLLPSDVTGINIFNPKTRSFQFEPGPVFSNLLLADEINRATPRTQSALLECMQEQQVTVSGQTRMLPRPFLTVATQNPVDMSGTFPLPAAQMDRFLLRIRLGYPQEEDEYALLRIHPTGGNPESIVEPIARPGAIEVMQKRAQEVYLSEELRRYIVGLVRSTREREDLELGASPRSAIMLAVASRALAFLMDRDYVIPDDVLHLLVPVLGHRLIRGRDTTLRGREIDGILAEIAEEVPLPVDAS
ncbi:MAG: AAA family ATPase [Bacillota bacterium]